MVYRLANNMHGLAAPMQMWQAWSGVKGNGVQAHPAVGRGQSTDSVEAARAANMTAMRAEPMRGMERLFGSADDLLRGEDRSKDVPHVHVGAEFTSQSEPFLQDTEWLAVPFRTFAELSSEAFERYKDPIRVRVEGMTDNSDIGHAVRYMQAFVLGFGEAVKTMKDKGVSVRLGEDALTYSYARHSFRGVTDLNADVFGKEIVLEPRATPDILLHEVLHAVPLSVLRREMPQLRDFPEPPLIVPSDRYSSLRQAICENMRLAETLSFGGQCLSFELERQNRITPIFNEPMMSHLDDAFQRGGWTAVRDTFPQYLPHYESRLERVSTILALIVKVEGRLDITDEEFERIQEIEQSKNPLAGYVKYFQNYLDRYVQEQNLEVPPDFYSLEAIIRRIDPSNIAGAREAANLRMADIIEGVFQSIEAVERVKEGRDVARDEVIEAQPLAKQEVPPVESQGDRTTLFAAYTGVVDRFLENPPANLTREELASLVSYVRMVPQETAHELADRLQVYLASGYDDLKVTLGLMLYEKGSFERGRMLVDMSLKPEILAQAAPLIRRIMGGDALNDYVVKIAHVVKQKGESVRRTFYGYAADQFMWFDADLERTAHALFSHPELIAQDAWQDVGRWIYDTIDDVDTTKEEDDLFSLKDHFGELKYFGEAPEEYNGMLADFLEMLAKFQRDYAGDAALNETIDRIRAEVKDGLAEGYAAVAKLIEHTGNTELLPLLRHPDLLVTYFTRSEQEEIFGSFPPDIRSRARALAQLDAPLTSFTPEELLANAQDVMRDIVKAHAEEEVIEVEDASLLFAFMNAAADCHARMPEEKALEYGRAWQRIIDDLLKQSFGNLAEEIFKVVHLFMPSDAGMFFDKHIKFDDALGSHDELSHKYIAMALYVNAARFLPSSDARVYVERGIAYHRKALIASGDVTQMDSFAAPSGLYLLLQAQRHGFVDLLPQILSLLFRAIPQKYPAGKYAEDHPHDDKAMYGDLSYFIKHNREYEWLFTMELARLETGGVEWLHRVRDELRRGSPNVTMNALSYFAGRMIREGSHDNLEGLYRLMILKSLMEPNEANVRTTLVEIQASPLADESKDDLLEGFVRQLFDLATAFRGVNLSLIQRLEHLFPWRTPFMRVGDVPHYPRTEELLIRRLATIRELVEAGRGKDDRVRLAAFAAAGLPLQRYHRWIIELCTSDNSPAELARFGLQKNYWETLKRSGLPHPYTIGMTVKPDVAEKMIASHGDTIAGLLAGNEYEPALRLIGRVLGSELRALVEASDEADVSKTHAGRFLIELLKVWYANAQRPDHLAAVQELLFSSGPRETRRMGVAREMLGWGLTQDERGIVFNQATSHLVFSTSVQKRLDALAKGPEEKEREFRDLLLSINYERHPGHMISNLLLARLEREKELREAYRDVLAGKTTDDPLLLAELGLSGAVEEGARIRHFIDTSAVTAMEFLLQALEFLKIYMEVSDADMYCDGYYFPFKRDVVMDYADQFVGITGWDFLRKREMIEATARELSGRYIDWELDSDFAAIVIGELDDRIEDIQELLAAMPIVDEVNDALDTDQRAVEAYIGKLDEEIERIREAYRDVIMSDLSDRLEGVRIPDFIDEREGLERDLLVFVMESLGQGQRRILDDNLRKAQTDRERIYHVGRAAHLEKLLQLASIHPAVPPEYQKLFSVFQEDMPHRDIQDVRRTLETEGAVDAHPNLDLNSLKPIKEGTIGGVYSAKLGDDDIAVKVIAEGKMFDIEASLQLIRDVRRFLWASRYAQPGARSVDDLLSFYERVIQEELTLSFEIDNEAALRAILPPGFIIPDTNQLPTIYKSVAFIGMNLLHAKRLKDMDVDERDEVFRRIDEELVPAMIAGGVIHYDLHPGNMGQRKKRDIVLYDLGRVAKLSSEEQEMLMKLSWALGLRNVEVMPDILRRMGTVRDEKDFGRIGELLQTIADADDALTALEEVYPRLADYGYVLHDNFVKLLLMFVTWRGTKRSFDAA